MAREKTELSQEEIEAMFEEFMEDLLSGGVSLQSEHGETVKIALPHDAGRSKTETN